MILVCRCMAALRCAEGDLSLKSGAIGEAIRERDKTTSDCSEKAPTADNTNHSASTSCNGIREWLKSRKKCIEVSLPCLLRRRAKVYAFDEGFSQGELIERVMRSGTRVQALASEGELQSKSKAHKMRGKKHEESGLTSRQQEIWIEERWESYVAKDQAGIKKAEVKKLMEELNKPKPVSEFAVEFVTQTCDSDASGCMSLSELKQAVPLYLALQSEQRLVDEAFDGMDASGSNSVPVSCLGELLTTVNDGITPTTEELEHIIARVRHDDAHPPTDYPFDGRKLGGGPETLSRSEVWRAVAVLYPRVHARRAIPAPEKMVHGRRGGRRHRVRTEMEQWIATIDDLINTKSMKCIMDKISLKELIRAVQDQVYMVAESSKRRLVLPPIRPASELDEAVEFVLHVANIQTPDLIAVEEVKPALALYLAVREELSHIDEQIAKCDVGKSDDYSRDDVAKLLRHIDQVDPSADEVTWVMQVAASGCTSGSASLKQRELRRAIVLWVPRVMMRRAIETDVKLAANRATGARRRAVALQIGVHERWVGQIVQPCPDMFGRSQLQAIMTVLCDGADVLESDVDLVLVLAEHPLGHKNITKNDVVRPLAMWRSLQNEMQFIDEHFSHYDINSSGKLDETQLQALLRDINGGHPPSREELDWFLSWDTSGKGICQTQLHAAVAIWFHHVSPLKIKTRVGYARLIPFIYCLVACVSSSVVVAATTVLFSEEKTMEWLAAVAMSLVWRNFVIDPLKAVMCGRSFEFVFGLLLGGCALEDAAMGVMQDEIEGSTEAVAEGAVDVMDDLAGGADSLPTGGTGEILGGGELTAGAGANKKDDGEIEET
eukprot:COSAG02_NODE_5225_length_4526_cov_4.817032_3_plen_834_part_00